MPMTGPARVWLMNLLELGRPDWDREGINTATKTLAAQDGHPIDLCHQAFAAARIASNMTPECITWTQGPHLRPAPAHRDLPDPCPTHGMCGYQPNGERTCCWQDTHLPDKPQPFTRNRSCDATTWATRIRVDVFGQRQENHR